MKAGERINVCVGGVRIWAAADGGSADLTGARPRRPMNVL